MEHEELMKFMREMMDGTAEKVETVAELVACMNDDDDGVGSMGVTDEEVWCALECLELEGMLVCVKDDPDYAKCAYRCSDEYLKQVDQQDREDFALGCAQYVIRQIQKGTK